MMTWRKILVWPGYAIFAAALMFAAAAGDGAWLSSVPAREHARDNPFAGNHEAAQAGARLFSDHCAVCHGAEAQGRGRKPGLHSIRIRDAAPGDLQWLLNNGSLKNGMPSWARLPEQQRWQIVTYLKTLP